MANIALLNYCNLNCPYCFANKYITEEEKQLITMEQFNYILEFLSRSRPGRLGLIGGEPTIHPNIEEILKRATEFCLEHKTNWTMFTNGIKLHNILSLFDKCGGCLINLNHPDVVGESSWEEIIKSLNRAKLRNLLNRINIGINLYPNMDDYSYIFEITNKYEINHIRVSYVAPTCEFQGSDKDKYYNEAKDIFIPFVENAKKNGIEIRLDCNHIPTCYFTEEEIASFDGIVTGVHAYCNPVVDISPDFKGTSCFGAYELVDLHQFNTLEEAERYFLLKKMYPLSELNCGGKCATCPKHENTTCQGGCLAFAKYNKN